jgi:hypothetical protein
METIFVAFGSAIVGGLLTWYLQRWWTPDRSVEEIAALRKQVAEFQSKLETLERERSEGEHFPLELRLEQTEQANYVGTVKNDSDYEVNIEAIKIIRNGTEICETKPKPTDNWTIPRHSGRPITWSPQPDPAGTLKLIETSLAKSNVILIEIVLICRIEGRLKRLPFSKRVAIPIAGGTRITPF